VPVPEYSPEVVRDLIESVDPELEYIRLLESRLEEFSIATSRLATRTIKAEADTERNRRAFLGATLIAGFFFLASAILSLSIYLQ
jgi:hypothetical protein